MVWNNGRLYTGKRYSADDARQLANFYERQVVDNDQLALLQPYLYNGWFSHYLIVPVTQAVQSGQEQQLLRMVAWLDAHKKIEPFAHAIKLERLPPVMQAFFTTDIEINQWRTIWLFDIYRIKHSMWRELVISHSRHQPDLGG